MHVGAGFAQAMCVSSNSCACKQSGFSDGNAYIRELTLKAMMPLAPKLSNKTLVGSVLKHLSKLQVG
jgi:hypothetical protein